MVAKITTGSSVRGALAYNQQKVEKAQGTVLTTNILTEPEDGFFDISQTAEELQEWMPPTIRTEKPVIHISLNPDPRDILADEQLVEIAEKYMERMGWGEQPYIVFKHTDIERAHIHIVSVQVRRDGKKINDSKRNLRSVAATQALEMEYDLHPAKSCARTEETRLAAVDPAAGDIKRQISSVVRPLLQRWRFQTLGEFRALLSLYNIGLEEVQGIRNGRDYRGLIYTVSDKNGQQAEVPPLKSSLLGKDFGFDALEKQMARSAAQIATGTACDDIRARIAAAFVAAISGADLRSRLHAHNIDLFIRRNSAGRITGATFIDHSTRTVFNGSRIGKQYSANAIQDRFGAELASGLEHISSTISTPPKQIVHKKLSIY